MHNIILPANRFTRMIQSYAHPDQAAIAARIPLIGRRVPVRGFWRRQGVDPNRIMRRVTVQALSTGRDARDIVSRVRNIDLRGARWPIVVAGVSVGAAMMFYADPQQGRRRRALAGDRLTHLRRRVTRDLPRRAERRGRFLRGIARGVRHNGHHALPVDNETLVARVRSEVLRQGRYKSGEIHLDAYEGCVTLRGQLPGDQEIRDLVHEVQRVEGVRDVRSYLHLPGTLPPNKAGSYGAEAVPAHMAGNGG